MINSSLRIIGRRYGLTIILGALVASCLATIGYESGWGEAWRPSAAVPRSGRAAEVVAVLPAFSMPTLDTNFKETAERPLFMPARRPVLAGATNVVAMKKGQFKLTGTSVAPDMSVAYLLETATGKTIRVAKGRDINGILVDTIESARVVLKQGEESEELVLRTAASPPKPAVPAGATAGQPGAMGQPSGVPPVASGGPVPLDQTPAVATVQAIPSRPAPPFMPSGMAPQAGASQLPGFVPGAASPTPAGANAAVPDPNAVNAQRRRRFQNLPQQ